MKIFRGVRVRVVPAPGNRTKNSQRRPWVWILGLAFLLAAGLALPVVTGALYQYRPFPSGAPSSVEETASHDNEMARRLEGSLRSLEPRRNYIVVDTSQNQLYVRKGDQIVYQATCSTGSGLLLRDPGQERQWIFDTPRGYFQVARKAVDPTWTKPDWAFIEEGKPVPRSLAERRDEDTLGDYALYFGDGYMIHGTLYQRYLGKSITHGCIRLGDQDLERVYHLSAVGTPIYIY
ncbi:MAG TPA: L,D-transpeptidase [Vicinamibacteria bacterium]